MYVEGGGKYTINEQCSVQYTIITLFNVGNVLLFIIY
jgi:hypothetical protein